MEKLLQELKETIESDLIEYEKNMENEKLIEKVNQHKDELVNKIMNERLEIAIHDDLWETITEQLRQFLNELK